MTPRERTIKILLEEKSKTIIKKEELVREIWRVETIENEINEKLKKYGFTGISENEIGMD